MTKKRTKALRQQALDLFREHGGFLRTSELLAAGVHSRILYELRDSGQIELVERGLYVLADLPDIADPDFVIISKKVRVGIICLISALYFHQLTVQIPRWIDVAVPAKYTPPRITQLPVRFHWFSEKVFSTGVELQDLGGTSVRVYGPEKTIVDCFRLRRKVGIDVALEGLKTYWNCGNANIPLLLEFARSSGVAQILQPYLEAVLHDQS